MPAKCPRHRANGTLDAAFPSMGMLEDLSKTGQPLRTVEPDDRDVHREHDLDILTSYVTMGR